ncbi:hypothetical protein HDU76_011142 [Blyttiomyces sp. JEL0837]|nr:hypothetical protein HDU76_011142 [Blyttiomyces sp. JEL0837]
MSHIASQDIQIELAVNETNQDPTVLPETFVKIIRVNNWDPEKSQEYLYSDSGGYASVRAIDTAQHKDVVAVIGEYYSKTAVFRMMSSVTRDSAVLASWLKYANIKRVAIVSGFDKLSVTTRPIFERTFTSNGINIITNIYISADSYNNNDYREAYATLKSVDARYIILIASAGITTDFYVRANSHALIGQRYVWFGINPPTGEYFDMKKVYGADAAKLVDGFLYVAPGFDLASPQAVKFDQKWSELMKSDPILPTWIETTSAAQPYDCVKALVYGLHEFLLKNPHYTPEMLSNRTLNEYLLPPVFSKTGYEGVSANPITLSVDGNLEVYWMGPP